MMIDRIRPRDKRCNIVCCRSLTYCIVTSLFGVYILIQVQVQYVMYLYAVSTVYIVLAAPNYPDPGDQFENCMDIEVGTGHGYLIAVGQTSTKTKTGWALAFNPQHAGMFITGNSDGSIACWDLNMVDNKQSMTMHGKFKNNKNSAVPESYMKDSKVQ